MSDSSTHNEEDKNPEYRIGGFTIGPSGHAIHAFMSGAELPGANLRFANLAHSCLSHANLEGADLSSM
jgi:uncharacterized protein YjbI with pentapeptide repeats